ncbi:unnamed protein product, partial [Rotaria sp. Silwood2]
MMTPLLRKLVHDVPALTDQTIVPLRMLTQWYEQCSRYYTIAAAEEEKRLTMMLSQKIFDTLASRAYDPELFGKALPCLTDKCVTNLFKEIFEYILVLIAIGSALSPDYAYSITQQDYLDHEREKVEMSRSYESNPADTSNVVLSPTLEDFVKAYAESVHDQWSYAKYFKREELNFVTTHDIDNTSMLMPSGTNQTTNTTSTKTTNDVSGKPKRKKRRLDKEKFTSLNVACIKRLLTIGMNTFGGREQELVQLAKHKMIEIGSKSYHSGINHSEETSIKNMLKMAKVLFGLHFVDHPPTHRRSTWRKLVSSQRKKAIMACFRMAPLHSVTRHRAMNMFLRAYRELWLEAEEDIRARLIEDLCRMLNYLKETKDVGCFTSLATLMANCSVLDLDTFERCIKAEVLGVGSEGMAGEKNLHDADFIISLFRFCQLLCEGHNLEFQNYLRLQPGSSTNVNIIICTVDYLLSLQESLMDFYWHYSGKETVDSYGKENLCRAISVAKQVFNTLTEYIQGPCPQNQLALANSRLWDAIAGFLYIFAHMQRKLSQDPTQIELLREFMKLQKDMIIMLLSMLEGNVLNGPIGKQMVDTLIESQVNVELLLQFFDIFLKIKDLTTSEAFQEYDANKDGFISPKEFRRAMEAQKVYTNQDMDYILNCVDINQDGKIDFMEFTERFHNPARDIGFNMAVLLTNLSEHMPHDIRLQRLMDKGKSFLSYFQDHLGRIEIKGGAGYIERVYFEITESNIEQWNKPHIKESKKAFLHLVVNETDDKEKLEQFINFCEDTIFEMQHAVAISGEEDDQTHQAVKSSNIEPNIVHSTKSKPIKLALSYSWSNIKYLFHLLHPSTIYNTYNHFRQMTFKDMIKNLFLLLIKCIQLLFIIIICVFRTLTYCICNLMVEDDQQDIQRPERTSLPSLPHHHDYRLPSISIPQHGSADGEDLIAVNAFGVDLNLDLEIKHRMSLTDEEINLIVTDSTRMIDSHQKPSFMHNIDLSSGQYLSSSITSTTTQFSPSITTSGPYRSQSITATSMSQNGIEKSKRALEVNTQAEYQQRRTSANTNNITGEDDDVTPSEPPTRTDFGKKALALMARNYHTLKLMALCLAFIINFLMLFYRAMPLAAIVNEPGSSDDMEQVDEDENDNEIIVMDPKKHYMIYLLQAAAFLHSSIAFLMMISYYKLKVPLVIFKREKEIARKLEFEGAWLIDQPSENNSWILSYLSREWHKLVISSKSFPDSYWDKFVKKKVRNKYSDQFDYDELSRFLGMEKNDTPGKFEIVKPVETGLWAKIKSIDMRYQIWKWGIIFTDN